MKAKISTALVFVQAHFVHAGAATFSLQIIFPSIRIFLLDVPITLLRKCVNNSTLRSPTLDNRSL